MKLITAIKSNTKQLLVALFLFSASFLSAQNLFINEFLASNGTSITDESGDFEDWIEIYNSGTTAINLAGYYISDDPAELTLWKIPATNAALTTVPAGGYLILWADKDTDDGENHVDLKLGAGGESVVLVDPDGTTIVDQIDFGPQSEDVSYGRETDGATNLVFFSTPTPATMNLASEPVTFTINLAIPITSADDDGEEKPSGSVQLNSGDIEMGQDGASLFTSAFRFNNIELPEGAVILNAYLQFYAEEIQTGPSDLNIVADAAGNASPLLIENNNISSRVMTDNSVNWLPAPWPIIGANGSDQRTPNLSTVVQEVVDQSDWETGNSMAFILTGTGTRTAYSYIDINEDKVAVLHIQAEVPISDDPIDPVFINEIAAGGTIYEDASGKREDWIELYNPNGTEVNIGGLYLTDDYGDLDKWQIAGNVVIPAGGFITFFADDDTNEGIFHTNFKLKAKGEEVALVQLLPDGLRIIDSISYEEMPFLASYGRETDGGIPWKLFGEVTPESTNENALLYLEAPEFSMPSGVYADAQTLTLSHSSSDADIYFTTDGSFPNENSNFYNNPIFINETTSIRAIAMRSGYADSQPKDNVYQVNDQANMPVLHLTTDPDNFFDDEIGIYVDGTNGVVGFCSNVPVNWAQDWERPCNLKLFLPDGSVAFDVNAGVEISGACSRENPMKSLAINLREKVFGDGSLKYELFPQRDLEDYQRLKIRGSGQDFYRLGFRDMLNQTLLFRDDINIEVQAGKPTLLYLNGEFWGIYNLREKYSGEHFEELYGVKESDIDIIKSPGLPYRNIKKGSDADYNSLFDFVENSDMNSQADYDYFETQVDLEEFTNYWVAMSYMANYDWPANNLTVWRDRVNQTKWRYGVADTDGSTFNFLTDEARPEYNTFETINDTESISWPNHKNSTLFLRKLLERTDFRDEFLQRTCTFMEVVFNEERTHPLIDSIAGLFQPNLQRHLDKWGRDNGMNGNAMGGTEPEWNKWIGYYKDFWETRPDFMRQHMNDFYDLNEYYNLSVNVDENTEGTVLVNTNEMEIPFQYTGVYFKNIPLRLTAVPKEGFSFSYWLETGVTDSVIDYVGTGDAMLTPIFVSDGPVIICPSNINETVIAGALTTIVTWETPIVNSNCTIGNLVVTQTAGPVNGSAFPIGSTTITYEVTDGCNAVATCSFEVVVEQDNGFLSLNCPRGVVVDVVSGVTEAIVNWADPIAETTCGLDGVVVMQTEGPASGELFPVGTTTISYQVVDDCGNEANCSFPVFVNGPPETLTITCPSDNIFVLPIGTNGMEVNWPLPTTSTTCGGGEQNPNCGSSLVGFTPLVNLNGQEYYLSTTKKVWTLAQAECEAYGGYLTVIEDAEENQLLFDNIDAVVHIGLNDQSNEGSVEWINGAPLAYTNYRDDIENNEINDYGSLQPWDGKWNVYSNLVYKYSVMELDCGVGSPVTLTQTGGPVNGSVLTPGVYFVAYTATDDCGSTATCSFAITILENETPSTEYCESEGTAPWQQWISNVNFNTINNDSQKDRYGDFTETSTSVDIGADYTFSITSSFSWEHWDEYVRVWIDYNGDNDFNDAGELVLEQIIPAGTNGTPSETMTGTISIPVDAPAGIRRMRVAMKQAAFADPCETFTFGEVEDYTVLINASATVREEMVDIEKEKRFTLFPNPATDEVFLNLKDFVGSPATIHIYNTLGAKVAEQRITELPDKLLNFDLSNLGSGLYLVSVQIGDQERMIERLLLK